MSTDFALVFHAHQRRAVIEAALVLSAMGIEHFVEHEGRRWSLWVTPADETRAREQLQLYWQENQPLPDISVEAETVDSGWPGVVGYLGVIWLVPAVQSYVNTDLRAAGHMHAGAVMEGEWWRVITALTLHSDIAHIASNSLFGVVFGLFVGRYLGSGFGWLLVLACGAFANSLNAMIQADGFRSLGASTATFACLGLIPAFGWRRGYFRGHDWRRGFAPIFGAIALLAFTGFGAENVDVMAHLFGFGAGIGMGLGIANINLSRFQEGDQQRAGIAGLVIIAFAWFFALA